MVDLAILAGSGSGPVYTAIAAPADQLTWLEPAPHDAPDGAVRYRGLLRFGASGPLTPFVYIVEQDADPQNVEELNAWYAQEHMPRLAAVPGVVAARRYIALGGARTPKYLAAYWLERQEVFESAAWIEARVTPWTERARTLFRNPRRTMRRLERLP